jgi:hypothetical protein
MSSVNGDLDFAAAVRCSFGFTDSDMNLPRLPSLIQADSQYSAPPMVRLPL